MNPLNYPESTPRRPFSGDSKKVPLATDEAKYTKNTPTEFEPLSKMANSPSNVSAGGRTMSNSGPTNTNLHQVSYEGERFTDKPEAYGRIEVKTNHPNKKLNKIYS